MSRSADSSSTWPPRTRPGATAEYREIGVST
jgi:hypothetical protein